MIDRIPGAHAVGEHLARLGHVRVDYLEPTFNRDSLADLESTVDALLASLKAGMKRKGDVRFYTTPVETLPGRSQIETHGFSAKSMYEMTDAVIERYLDDRTDATAVVVANTMIAYRLIGMMRRRGLQCPKDLSVVPFSVENWTDSGPLPMTALEYSTDLMARKAIASILAVKAGQKVSNVIKVPTMLVERDSSGSPAKGNGPRR